MEILPINNLTRIVEPSRHGDHEQPQRRQQPGKRQKIVISGPVYTPDGHVDEEPPSKIDVVG